MAPFWAVIGPYVSGRRIAEVEQRLPILGGEAEIDLGGDDLVGFGVAADDDLTARGDDAALSERWHALFVPAFAVPTT